MVNQVLKLIFSLLTLLNYSKGGQIFLVFCSHKHIIGTFCRSFTIPIALHIVEGIAFFFFPPFGLFQASHSISETYTAGAQQGFEHYSF